MNVSEAMAQAREIKPDSYSDEVMTVWLSEVDGSLQELLGQEAAVSYRWPEDGETQLLVPHPYDRVYALYMVAMTDFHNRQLSSYQNDMQMYNAAMDEYRCAYRRTHTPPGVGGWKTM